MFQREFQRAEVLTELLVAHERFMVAELILQENQIATCEADRSLELERGRESDVDCRRLQSQLLIAAQAKLMETQTIIGRLEHNTDVGLRARVELCLCGYVDWEIQITKWMKLELFDHRLRDLEANELVGH